MQRKTIHRWICSVLDEIREQIKLDTYERDSQFMLSLLEEAQTYANRMEAALGYKSDLEELHEERDNLNKEILKLEKKRKKLRKEIRRSYDE